MLSYDIVFPSTFDVPAWCTPRCVIRLSSENVVKCQRSQEIQCSRVEAAVMLRAVVIWLLRASQLGPDGDGFDSD
ncbi:hypothetical protein EVAR_71573_1 [Eumeta japonica]|uniref:Uncharacterized protein n=1 Tax=Eumeta variegata TaxID=151549 RepID=A0A4C1TF22_EUMVA|nr:hypothetical protein EVAR_71573_1 [Eumeta japonica]